MAQRRKKWRKSWRSKRNGENNGGGVKIEESESWRQQHARMNHGWRETLRINGSMKSKSISIEKLAKMKAKSENISVMKYGVISQRNQ